MSKVEVNFTDEGDLRMVEVAGELDASSSITLEETLKQSIQSGYTNIIIDCQRLDYISSAGIGVFTSRIDAMKKGQLKLVLFGLNNNVTSVFNVLGLDRLLPIASDKQEAKSKIHGL